MAGSSRVVMSAIAFAKWSGVKYQTLATWLQKARKEQTESKVVEPMRWAEAVCEPRACGGEPPLVIPGWRCARGSEGRTASGRVASCAGGTGVLSFSGSLKIWVGLGAV